MTTRNTESIVPQDACPVITPDIKISRLLEQYPELEETLIDLSPAFQKLRNPLLRRTLARMTTLKQAAKVAGIDLDSMIESLCRAVGIERSGETVEGEERSNGDILPGWFSKDRVRRTLDARPILEAGNHPLAQVFDELKLLGKGEIFELLTPFLPEPLIQKAREKSFEVWSDKSVEGAYRSFFIRSGSSKE